MRDWAKRSTPKTTCTHFTMSANPILTADFPTAAQCASKQPALPATKDKAIQSAPAAACRYAHGYLIEESTQVWLTGGNSRPSPLYHQDTNARGQTGFCWRRPIAAFMELLRQTLGIHPTDREEDKENICHVLSKHWGSHHCHDPSVYTKRNYSRMQLSRSFDLLTCTSALELHPTATAFHFNQTSSFSFL
jgi:hypothetical protein